MATIGGDAVCGLVPTAGLTERLGTKPAFTAGTAPDAVVFRCDLYIADGATVPTPKLSFVAVRGSLAAYQPIPPGRVDDFAVGAATGVVTSDAVWLRTRCGADDTVLTLTATEWKPALNPDQVRAVFRAFATPYAAAAACVL